jgi:hypothetical protein
MWADKIEEINMPSLLGTTVAANYGKMTAQQTYGVGEVYSNFGTRQLAFFKIALANVNNDGAGGTYTDANSLFSKAVRGLQLNTEVYYISAPVDASTDYFCVAVSYTWSKQQIKPTRR